MQIPYKIPQNKNIKYNNYLNVMRPPQFKSSNASVKNKSDLNQDRQKEIKKTMAFIVCADDETVYESIESFINLMIENSEDLFQSAEFRSRKASLPDLFIKLLNNQSLFDITLHLLSILLDKNSEFDKPLIEKGIASILAQIFDCLRTDDRNIYIISNIFTVSKLLAQRELDFCHYLFETNFYEKDHLVSFYCDNKIDEDGECINIKIAELLYKTSLWCDEYFPIEINYIMNMLPMLLKSDDSSIVKIGYFILSKLASCEEDVQNIIKDGLILQNLIRFIPNDDIKFVIQTIQMLANFASFGEKIIDTMDSLCCLQNISQQYNFHQDPNLIDCIFNLSKFWLLEKNNSLENMFFFLKNMDFIYIFENHNFDIKKKAIHVLRLASSADTTEQILDIVNHDLLIIIIDQISASDDFTQFIYDGCFLIRNMIRILYKTQFCDQIKSFLTNDDFCNKLEEIQFQLDQPDDKDLVKIANKIISFIRS